MKSDLMPLMMAGGFGLALSVFGSANAQAAPEQPSYELTCKGTAEPVYGELGSRVDALLGVKIDGSAALIHLPPDMIPPLRGPASGGWRSLSKLNVGDDLITGEISMNVLNHIKVKIDRRTGSIETSGPYQGDTFSGFCELIVPTQRKF